MITNKNAHPIILIGEDRKKCVIDADDYMRCQIEYDRNLDHVEITGWWAFFNEFFKNVLSCKVNQVDRNSDGYSYLCSMQRHWNSEKEKIRQEKKRWRNELNRKNAIQEKRKFLGFRKAI